MHTENFSFKFETLFYDIKERFLKAAASELWAIKRGLQST